MTRMSSFNVIISILFLLYFNSEVFGHGKISQEFEPGQGEKTSTAILLEEENIVFNIKTESLQQTQDVFPITNSLPSNLNEFRSKSIWKSKTRDLKMDPDIEVELHVIVDTELQNYIRRNDKIKGVTEYLKIFFDSANSIYANSHPYDDDIPTIAFRVVKLTKLTEQIEKKLFTPAEDADDFNVIDIQQVLKNMKKQANKSGKFDKYDHTMVLTGRDLYYRNKEGIYKPNVLGAAFLGGVCKKSKSEEKRSQSISVVEDVGGLFLGVYAAVHEFAHNLGASHDKGGCYPQDGYIMSPQTRFTSNMFHFSECSLNSIRESLRSKTSSCLKEGNRSSIFNDEEYRLPGDVYDLEELCDLLGELQYPNEIIIQTFPNPNKSAAELCKQISCRVELSSGKRFSIEPPFSPGENTACGYLGKGKCTRGECTY